MGPTQVWPVTRATIPEGPVALIAVPAAPPDGLSGHAIEVPFSQEVGAALFTRGDTAYVVFDERRPIDLSELHDDPVFGAAVVTIWPSATVIRVTLPAGDAAMLSRTRSNWRIAVVGATPAPAALVPVAVHGDLTFRAEAPGRVVAITDPWTGGTLLVGTQRVPGQGVLVPRRTPQFLLPATGQGIVVAPLADSINLRAVQSGFVLSGPAAGLALSPPPPLPEAALAAARLTRRFEFPDQTIASLFRRWKRQFLAAALTPPRARGPERVALAETWISLGLGVEARTLLQIAAADDPKEAASPLRMGLSGVAALLAGRPEESGDLNNPSLDGTDEVTLWRAIQIAMTDAHSQKAAQMLATTAPLLFTYPTELRDRVLPLAMETMVLGGDAKAAAPLLAERPDDPRLAFARALLKEAQGDDKDALRMYDRLVRSRSPWDHARAAAAAVELRLKMGQLDAKGAADALEKHLYAWRGDAWDLALRRRIAALRRQSGDWVDAFALLRGAMADFPAHANEIRHEMEKEFASLPSDPALDHMAPAELVAFLDENSDLMPSGPEGEPIRALLARKLMALDLPAQADPVLNRLMRAAPLGPARAALGATLATVRLHENDPDGALLALSESNASDMPDAVRARRALITARVEARRGHIDAAMAALAGVKTVAADEARANILERAKRWPQAVDALNTLVAREVPATGALNGGQTRLLLRLAAAATHAGDQAALTALREKMGARIGTGPVADTFRVLTEAPIRGTADLARARAELGVAEAITAGTPAQGK
jgi:hypothetical protein